MASDARWLDWGGRGPRVLFAHANGFPIAAYRPFLDRLAQGTRVTGWRARPLRPGTEPQSIATWDPLAGDLKEEIAGRFDGPVIGVGHSLGGVVSLLAAASRPDLFRALVLLDPVVFTGFKSLVWRLIKYTRQTHRVPIVVGALRRRDHWPDRETVRRAWNGRPDFDNWTSEAFDAYIEAGLTDEEGGDGLTLTYPKAWEVKIFETAPHDVWAGIRRLDLPVLLLRGERTDTFSRAAARRFVRSTPATEYRDVPGTGHLLPMQSPDLTGSAILDWVSKLD